MIEEGFRGTESLSLGNNCETTAPLFWQTAPGFAISKFTASSFHGYQWTAPWKQR